MRKLPVILVFILLSACESPGQFTDVTRAFATATEQASTAYRDEIIALDGLAQTTHLKVLRANPSESPDVEKLNDEARLLGPNGLRTRFTLIAALTRYTQLLQQAATTDIGSEFAAEATAFGQAAAALPASLSVDGLDPRIGEGVQGVANIVGTVGKAIVQQKQAEAIRAAILEKSGSVNEALHAMRDDIVIRDKLLIAYDASTRQAAITGYGSQQSSLCTGQQQRVGQLPTYDNCAKFAGKPHDAAWTGLSEIIKAQQIAATLESSWEPLFNNLVSANTALVAFAKKSGNNQDPGVLIARADVLVAHATQIIDLAKQLNDLT